MSGNLRACQASCVLTLRCLGLHPYTFLCSEPELPRLCFHLYQLRCFDALRQVTVPAVIRTMRADDLVATSVSYPDGARLIVEDLAEVSREG